MQLASIILFLIACTVDLSADSRMGTKSSTPQAIRMDTVGKNPDESLIALTATDQGSEKIFDKSVVNTVWAERKRTRFLLGTSKRGQNIEAWYFPGTSEKRALVIGGVHGTELVSTEVAKTLIDQLQRAEKIYYNVIVIPCLFPDNASLAKQNVAEIGSTANIGRYSFSSSPDPNRQMPSPGEPFDEGSGKDHLGREIEKENRLLLQLISFYKPGRIANIHAIRELSHAGIYADPRTNGRGFALGFESDSILAISMASLIASQAGYVPGNTLDKRASALYYRDPAPVLKGNLQKRNFAGSSLPGNRGSGISLGTWASTAIESAKDPSMNRDAIQIVTIEFPGYKRPGDYPDRGLQDYFGRQVQLYAASVEKIFLCESFGIERVTGRQSLVSIKID